MSGDAITPATALAADGVRVLTYNTAFLYLEAESPNLVPLLPQCVSCDPLELPPLSPLGTPCECFPSMVLYPNEGHGFLGQGAPACRVDAARRLIEWVSRHTLAAAHAHAGAHAPGPRQKETAADETV